MDQIFNELSVSAVLENKSAALESLYHVAKASSALEKIGLSRQIRVTEDFETRTVAQDYSLSQWLHDKLGGRDRTVQVLLKGRLSRAPYVEQLCREQGLAELDDYNIGGVSCKGLALADLWGIPALSLHGDLRFNAHFVTVTHDFITEESETTVPQHEACTIPLARCEDDVTAHAGALKQRLQSPLRDGPSILEHAPALLPYVEFSKDAQRQLQEFSAKDMLFPRVRNILLTLNDSMTDVAEKKTRSFTTQGFKYTPTEGATATSGKKGDKHSFTFSDKVSRLCESHMRLSAGDRVYFCPEESTLKVYIGHIGKHLPTKNF